MCNLDRIIDKCKEGDRQAAEKIYQIFSAKMFALCLRFSKDRADAEDTLQDGFIKIFTSIGQYTGKGSFEGWMKRIMINTAMEKFRKNSPLQIVEELPEIEDNEDKRSRKGGDEMRRERSKVMRNGSGYHDPTAGTAILRADRHKRRTSAKLSGLTYLLGEVPDFPVILK